MSNKKWFGVIAVGLAIAVVVALFSPLASSHPDGLERVAEDKQFIDKAKDNGYEIIPDYTFPGIDDENLATIVSGLVGVGIVAALMFGAGYLLRSSKSKREGSSHNLNRG